MKLKVKCSSCDRVHLINKKQEDVQVVMKFNCMSCGSIIKFRIPELDEDENPLFGKGKGGSGNTGLEDLMKIFGMKGKK
jgi:hypothetical protein